MKKNYLAMLLTAVVFMSAMFALNISVTTRQGINGQVHEIKLPLYLKMLDFVDRHYNYKNLATNILGDSKDENTKTLKIFNWVTANVRVNPKELPIIDDHPLNILIRGYGMEDQFEDIFTILCTYAGMEAFFKLFKNYSGGGYYISFVKIRGRWCPLSTFRGAYATKDHAIASVNDILLDKKLLAPFLSSLSNFETDSFLKDIDSMDFKAWSVRTNGQSPAGRVSCLIKNMFYRNQK